MINQTVLAGRMAHDLELRYTQSGTAVGRFTLAVSRPKMKDKEQITDWIDCVLWGKSAEGLAPYLTKGKPIAVVGSIQTRNWEDDNGKKRKSVEVRVDRVSFLPEGKKSGQQSQQQGHDNEGFSEVPFDESDLPF